MAKTYDLNFTIVSGKLVMDPTVMIDLLRFFKQEDAVKKVEAATKR